MLRLVLLASVSLLSGCSCDALWSSYEVPCDPAVSSCPNGFPLTSLDMTMAVTADMSGNPSPPLDGSMSMSTDMGGSTTPSDMNMSTANDMGPPDIGIPDLKGPDLGILDLGTLDMDGFLPVPDAGMPTTDLPIVTTMDGAVLMLGDLGLATTLK